MLSDNSNNNIRRSNRSISNLLSESSNSTSEYDKYQLIMANAELSAKIDNLIKSFDNINVVIKNSATKDDIVTLTKKLDSDYNDIKKSLEFIGQDVDDLKKANSETTNNIKQLNDKYNGLKTENIALKKQVVSLDLRSRKDNIVVYGIAEPATTLRSPDDLKADITAAHQLINDTLGYKPDLLLLKNVERMGKPSGQASALPRPLKIRFLQSMDKFQVMGAYFERRAALLNIGIRVRDDLPESTRIFRTAVYKDIKRLFEAKKAARYVDDGVRMHDGTIFKGNPAAFKELVNKIIG